MSHDERSAIDHGASFAAAPIFAREITSEEDSPTLSQARRKRQGGPSEPPRYQMIAFDLEQEIVNGRYNIGEMLPTEADLVQRFNVSRFTVREALRQLERLGLVRRRRGSGTCVQSQTPLQQFTQRLRSLDDLLQYAPSRLHVQAAAKVRLTRAEAQVLEARHGETWYRADGMRCAIGSGAVLCTSTVWIRPEFSSIISTGDVIDGALHARLERVFGVRIEQVDVRLDCHVLTGAECYQLGVQPPLPVLRMSRRFGDARNRTLQVSRDALPANRFSYRARFYRDGGPS